MSVAPNGDALPGTTGEHMVPRGPARRSDDMTLKRIYRGFQRERWLFVVVGTICTVTSWVAAQAWGPITEDVRRVDGRVSLVDSLSRIEHLQLRATDAALREQINDLADHQKLSTYMICTSTRRTDPAAVPPECNQVILDWRRGVR